MVSLRAKISAVLPGGFSVPIARIAETAEAMVKAEPDAIVAGPDLQLRALQTLTKTIPLIGMTEDMVASGLVASLSRPGGNTTGISLLSPELDGKRQEILIEAVPGVRRMAALADSNVTTEQHLQTLRDAAQGPRHRTFSHWCCQAGGDRACDQRGQGSRRPGAQLSGDAAFFRQPPHRLRTCRGIAIAGHVPMA